MTYSLQNTSQVTQLPRTYQMEVARQLSHTMADNQARELLATDILYKVGNLALVQAEILKHNPEARDYTDYILRAFTYYTTQHLK